MSGTRGRARVPVAAIAAPLPTTGGIGSSHRGEGVSESGIVLFGAHAAPATPPWEASEAASARAAQPSSVECAGQPNLICALKRSISGPIYSSTWAWCRDQAQALSGNEWKDEGYPRAMQVLAEVLDVLVRSGLDVSGARTMDEVRELTRRHLRSDETLHSTRK